MIYKSYFQVPKQYPDKENVFHVKQKRKVIRGPDFYAKTESKEKEETLKKREGKDRKSCQS